MIIGEGTNEIQRTLIARQLLERYGERIGGLLALESEPVERRQMLLAVRQFVEKEIVPRPESLAMLEGLVDLGLLGAVVPVEHGGLGLDLLTCAMIVEEIAHGSATVAGVVAAHLTAAWAFARFGDDAQRSALARLTRAETVASAALAGTVTARRERTECVLTGMTTLADHAARADVVLVRATTEAGHLVVAVPQRAPGLRIGQAEDALGRALTDLRRRHAARRRRRRRRSRPGPALRDRDGLHGHAHRHANPRRLRLHDGVPRRTLLPRCAAPAPRARRPRGRSHRAR